MLFDWFWQNAALLDVATVSFTVTPLASGYSRDVHGTVSF